MLKRLVPALDLREFRLPGKLVTLAERAAEASRDAYSRQELKELIAFAGEDVACVCVKISGQTALLADILQSGECVALKALAVSGKDFPDLYGRAAGALLHALLRHVLKHPEDNNRQTLLHLAEENLNVDGYKQITDVKT